jgi:hypothetical protein
VVIRSSLNDDMNLKLVDGVRLSEREAALITSVANFFLTLSMDGWMDGSKLIEI